MLKIEYVCHSCLYIDTGDTTLVVDPWFKGTAYNGQWFLFPPPVRTEMLKGANHILISHGHNDHLHEESLATLNKSARIFFPYQWRKGITDQLFQLGFSNITEAITFHQYKVSTSTTISYIAYGLESVIVISVDDIVIVNLNDALNSNHENVVQMFLKEIKKRWPKIDYLFSGWSGAGYFPNTVHFSGKDDEEIGRIREQYFANNFCRFVHYLQPARAIPFAPGFALLADDKRWINDVKFPRTKAEQYYHENFEYNSNIKFFVINPGDTFKDGQLIKDLYYDTIVKDDSYYHLIQQVFEDEIVEFNRPTVASPVLMKELFHQMTSVLNSNAGLYDERVLEEATYSVVLKDVVKHNCFNIERTNHHFNVTIDDQPSTKAKLILTTTSSLLCLALEKPWGADSMTIGYGIDVEVLDESALEKNLDLVCVRLISIYPRTSEYLRKQPYRTLKWLATNPLMAKLALKQKLTLRAAVNKFPYNERDHWISYNKCDLCKVCDMPVLGSDFY